MRLGHPAVAELTLILVQEKKMSDLHLTVRSVPAGANSSIATV